MSKKRIDEIVEIICPHINDDGKCIANVHQFGVRECNGNCFYRMAAKDLIKAGYAKRTKRGEECGAKMDGGT